MNALSAPQVARLLADALGTANLPYAIGGALALGVWGFPRATVDVDLDVFVPEARWAEVADVLIATGCELDRGRALESARERGDFRAHFGAMRVDVFVPSIPFYDAVGSRRRQAVLDGRAAWFLSPEDLTVFKLLFFRPKDLIDVERMVAALGPALDRGYVERWLEELVGETDSRVDRWRTLLRSVDERRG